MSYRRPHHRHGRIFAIQAGGLWQKLRFGILLAAALWLIILSELKPQLLTPVRVRVVDSMAPLLDSLSRPADLVQSAQLAWTEWFDLRDEVQRLRAENARLKGWEQTGAALLAENQSLKELLNFKTEAAASSLTARVIATTGAPFAASLIVTAGSRDGVKRNMAALTDDGLVGRVIEVGEWSARVLLLTDPESRIPVMTQDNSAHAIVAGNGGNRLELRFLPTDARLTAGTRLVTSGHGGVLPPQLPVAYTEVDAKGAPVLQPMADPNRLHYVRLVDYGLAGGEANSFSKDLTPKAR